MEPLFLEKGFPANAIMIKILPAIDLYEGKAVRLAKGDYNQMKVYSDEPWKVAKYFRDEGAEYIHIVDLEGARDGGTPNIDTVKRIADTFGGFSEIGGGVRSTEVIETYLGAGISRVILGTAAAKDPVFLREATWLTIRVIATTLSTTILQALALK